MEIMDEVYEEKMRVLTVRESGQSFLPHAHSQDALQGIGEPLTHAERRSYKAMKDQVWAHCTAMQVIQTPPYTCVGAVYGFSLESTIERFGFSKCAPGDEWDADRGVQIATGRAVAAIARALMTGERAAEFLASPDV